MEPISVQQPNGLMIGSIHHSDHAYANITDHIGREMEEMVSHIKNMDSFISITIDGTTIFNKSYMIR